jgi:hypothetical protein
VHRYDVPASADAPPFTGYLIGEGTIGLITAGAGNFAWRFRLADNECVRAFVLSTSIEYLARYLANGDGEARQRLAATFLPRLIEAVRTDAARAAS